LSIKNLLKTIKNESLNFETDNFKKLIDDSIFKCQKINTPKVRTEFSASGISDTERQLYFSMIGLEQAPIPAQTLRKFDNGNDMHERYGVYFENANILSGKEIVVKKDEPPISGRLDAILNISNTLFVCELKSIHSYGFKQIYKTKVGKPEHISQLQVYMDITGINNGLLVYENKDDQEFVALHCTLDKELIKQLYAKLFSVLEYLKIGKLPSRCIFCSILKPNVYCSYTKICSSMEKINE